MNLSVIVVPNSSKDEIQINNDGSLKIKVREPPIEGRANEKMIKILSQKFGKIIRILRLGGSRIQVRNK